MLTDFTGQHIIHESEDYEESFFYLQSSPDSKTTTKIFYDFQLDHDLSGAGGGGGGGGDKEAFALQRRQCTHFVTHQDTCPDHTCKPQLPTTKHCLLTKEERSHSSG